MSMRTAIALAALALAATAANGGQTLRLMPPPEFDHAYDGRVDVVTARDRDHVRELCPGAKFGVTLGALACSIRYPASCTIVLAPEADIKATGVPLDVIMRHELGHCNGWPGDHKGALPYDEWAAGRRPVKTVPMTLKPTQPPTTEEWAETMPSRPCGLAIQKPCNQLDDLLFGTGGTSVVPMTRP